MDIGDTIAPNSDQLDAVDLLVGPQTFTIEKVAKNAGEQPVNIHLAEFPRPWRPGKSMRRVLVAAWGPDASTYAGRRLTLWCDPNVRFGGAAVGGVRILAMSHIEKPKTVVLLESRGKSGLYRVDVLPDVVESVTREQLGQLSALIKENGMDKAEALGFCYATTGREIGSATDLTKQEAASVIAALSDGNGKPDVASVAPSSTEDGALWPDAAEVKP